MLKALRISALIFVFVGPAHASDVLTPPAPQPPPQTAIVQEPAADGYLTDDTTDTMMEIALDMLAVLPSLF